VPLNRKYPLSELLDACLRYLPAAPRDFITFEYCMLDGVNDQPEHAAQLLALIKGHGGKGVPCKINLIPFNPFPDSGLKCSPRSVVQAFGQVPVKLSPTFCDLYLAGSHKWLGAYLPLGIGFCPRPESAPEISLTAQKIGDPMLRLLNQMDHESEDRFSETVNLTPLFSCRAALQDLGSIKASCAVRKANMAQLIARLPDCWEPVLPHEAFRSGILLLKAVLPHLQSIAPDELRAKLLSQGIALTVYADGLMRLSMPATAWDAHDLERLATGFSTMGTDLPLRTIASYQSAG